MKTNLYAASRQWSQRPSDERFWTLQELFERTKEYAEESRVKDVELNKCHISPIGHNGQDLALIGPSGQPARFQNYSFNQLSGIVKVPSAYVRELPAELAAQNLNHALAKLDNGPSRLLFHQNGGLDLRCITSDDYKRIWNFEIAALALQLEQEQGWRTPPARPCGLPGIPVRKATDSDVLRNSSHPSLGVRVGDSISPAGLYASDHDCFIFQVNEGRSIDGGDGESLYRGVFWSNSEVGSAKFRATLFLYDTVCGNHIVWGAKVLAEVSIRHTGEARRAFAEAMQTIRFRMDKQASEDERRIRQAKQYQIAPSKTETIDSIFGKSFGLSKSECTESYAMAERYESEHGDNPRSAWGFASGVTRLSQQQPFADKRDTMDRAAGKVLEMAF